MFECHEMKPAWSLACVCVQSFSHCIYWIIICKLKWFRDSRKWKWILEYPWKSFSRRRYSKSTIFVTSWNVFLSGSVGGNFPTQWYSLSDPFTLNHKYRFFKCFKIRCYLSKRSNLKKTSKTETKNSEHFTSKFLKFK